MVNFHSTLLELELLGIHISGCKCGLHHHIGWSLELNEKDGKERMRCAVAFSPPQFPTVTSCDLLPHALAAKPSEPQRTYCKPKQTFPSASWFCQEFVTAARKVTNTVLTHHPPLPVPI